MRALLLVLSVSLFGCSAVHVDVDAASRGDAGPPLGDASSATCPSLEIYNGSADLYGCPHADSCPACPVLINSGRDCATLARALEACPDGGR